MEQQHEHIVRSYEEELSLLNNKIAKMGGLAEQVLGQSFEALERRDPELAAATIKKDEEIDALQKEIEEQAVRMICGRSWPRSAFPTSWSASATLARTSPSARSRW